MNSSHLLLAAPEIWVLIMAGVIMVVDLFLPKERRGIIHMLAMLTVKHPNDVLVDRSGIVTRKRDSHCGCRADEYTTDQESDLHV